MLETADHSDPGVCALSAQPSSPLALLVCGRDGPQTLPLRPGVPLTLGRDTACDFTLLDPTLSRSHARFLQHSANLVQVEDLASRNGVFHAERRVQRVELGVGGSVRLGEVVVAVMHAPSRKSPPAAHARANGSEQQPLYVGERMRKLREVLLRAASSELPVVLFGETGTGKELAAQELHRHSARRAGPLRVLNCAAIPAQLVESTLFGHDRGAFTGADRARPGIFEEACGGTVFLDEVGELSLAAQAALLRVLETKRVARVGSTRELEVDVRIVAATHRDLQAAAARGEFRFDTLHRLCVISIELPPLRERREQIAALARHFLTQGEGARELEPEALSLLEAYDWPGNVRELRNVLLRASALATGASITHDDLPDKLRFGARVTEAIIVGASSPAPEPGEPALRTRLKSVERAELLRALDEAGGNQRRAAALLSLPLRTFERRLSALRKS